MTALEGFPLSLSEASSQKSPVETSGEGCLAVPASPNFLEVLPFQRANDTQNLGAPFLRVSTVDADRGGRKFPCLSLRFLHPMRNVRAISILLRSSFVHAYPPVHSGCGSVKKSLIVSKYWRTPNFRDGAAGVPKQGMVTFPLHPFTEILLVLHAFLIVDTGLFGIDADTFR